MENKFQLEIKTASLGENNQERNAEVIQILKKTIDNLERNINWDFALKDTKGNTVGTYQFVNNY